MSLDKPEWMNGYKILRVTRFPLEGSAHLVGRDLAHIEAALVEELAERRALEKVDRKAPDGLSPNNWLKEACYQIILSWHLWDFSEQLDDRIEGAGRLGRGTKKDDRDIFQLGLVALFAENPSVIPVPRRRGLTGPMWYAFRHYIGPAELNEFNRNYPGHKAHRADWREHIELKLEDWVVEQRTQSKYRGCHLDDIRAEYPEHIEARVEAELDKAYAALRNAKNTPSESPLAIDEDWPE